MSKAVITLLSILIFSSPSWAIEDMPRGNVFFTDAAKDAIDDNFEEVTQLVRDIETTGEANETMDQTPTTGNTDHTVSSDALKREFDAIDISLEGVTSATNDNTTSIQGKVGLSGNEEVAGVKTFTSSPIIPTPTTEYQAAPKGYVDANAGTGTGLASEATAAEQIYTSTAAGTYAWAGYDALKTAMDLDAGIDFLSPTAIDTLLTGYVPTTGMTTVSTDVTTMLGLSDKASIQAWLGVTGTTTNYSLIVDAVDFDGTDYFTLDTTDYLVDHTFTGLTTDQTFTVTANTGREISCSGTGLTNNGGGSYTSNTDSEDVTATCTSTVEVAGGSINDAFSSDTSANYGTIYNGIRINAVDERAEGSDTGGWQPASAYHLTSLASANHNVEGEVIWTTDAERSRLAVNITPGTTPTTDAAGYYVGPTETGFDLYEFTTGSYEGLWVTDFTNAGAVTWTTTNVHNVNVSSNGVGVLTVSVDWNDDGDFADANEVAGTLTDSTGVQTGQYIGLSWLNNGNQTHIDNLTADAN